MSDRLGDYSHYQILPEAAHTILTQACLGALLHLEDPIDDEGVKLAEYAAQHWLEHARFVDAATRKRLGI